MKTKHPNSRPIKGGLHHLKELMLLICALLFSIELAAQSFEVTPQKRGIAKAYGVVRDSENNWNATGDNIELKEGEMIEVIEIARKNSYIFMREGRYYTINPKELCFSEENAPEVENPISEGISNQNSAVARFYRSAAPAWIIILLLVAVMILSLVYLKSGWAILRLPTLIAIPALILLISLMEIVGFISVKGDMFWWCDYDTYGFFGSLWRVIPFMAVVWMQLRSVRLFERVIFLEKRLKDPENFDEQKHRISIKPAAIGILLCIPALIATALILESTMGNCNTLFGEIIMLIVFLGSLALGVIITLSKNVKLFGPFNGLLITIFSIVYAVGAMIAIGGVIVVIVELIFQILVVLGTFLVLSMLGTKRRFRGSDGRIYEEV